MDFVEAVHVSSTFHMDEHRQEGLPVGSTQSQHESLCVFTEVWGGGGGDWVHPGPGYSSVLGLLASRVYPGSGDTRFAGKCQRLGTPGIPGVPGEPGTPETRAHQTPGNTLDPGIPVTWVYPGLGCILIRIHLNSRYTLWHLGKTTSWRSQSLPREGLTDKPFLILFVLRTRMVNYLLPFESNRTSELSGFKFLPGGFSISSCWHPGLVRPVREPVQRPGRRLAALTMHSNFGPKHSAPGCIFINTVA
jgi:hypothetical protein